MSSNNILVTTEVVRTATCYWFFQEYDSDRILSLPDFLRVKSCEVNGSFRAAFLSIKSLRSLMRQLVGVFSELVSQKKFVHGNLDSRSVFIEQVPNSSELRVLVDPSEHHMLVKLLKISSSDTVETQEETTSEE